MHKQDKPPWDIEIEFHVDGGIGLYRARNATIIEWMLQGDLRPLAAAIVAGHEISDGVLYLLADMITGDASLTGAAPPYRLQTVAPRRGRRKKPEHSTRDLVAALAYEKRENRESSDGAFDRVAKDLGTSDRTVRQAVTKFRKSRRAT
jgi:hypothetical protein